MKKLALSLFEIGAVKFGSFLLKSGIISPIYIDLRLIVSYPALLKEVTRELQKKVSNLSYDLICGVPYTALPIATSLSLSQNCPMILTRKEKKEHGLKKMVEGVFKPGQRCLLIEDLITSGMSIRETLELLKKEEIDVRDIAIIIDREQGGKKALEKEGFHIHTLFTMRELLNILENENKIDAKSHADIKSFLCLS